jgi:type II secretory pathway pseudopilin PulG
MRRDVTAQNHVRQGERGTSLIELMLGAVMVITLLLAISSSVTSQSRTRRVSEERNLAMVACRNILERLRDTTFATVPALNNTGFDVPGVNGLAGGLKALPGDADGLPGHITVAVDQTASGQTLYLVTLDVDWTGVTGRQHFQEQTLLAERKP